jgi:hypothetical protein
MAKTRRLIDSSGGVMVVLRPGSYWRCPSSGKTYTGPRGVAGSAKYKPGSEAFRIPAALWQRQERLAAGERIFQRIDEPVTEAVKVDAPATE